MVDPIYDGNIPPFSPNASPDSMFHHDHTQSRGRVGHALYQEASNFYSWYQWMRKISDTEEGFHNLLIIMQIAHKEVLTPEEEHHALSRLQELRDDLEDVKKTIDQIPYSTRRILEELVENNPKSHVIQHATELEMQLIQSIPGEDIAAVKGKMEGLIDKVSSTYTQMESEQLGRQLQAISHISNPREMLDTLERDIFPLLDKR